MLYLYAQWMSSTCTLYIYVRSLLCLLPSNYSSRDVRNMCNFQHDSSVMETFRSLDACLPVPHTNTAYQSHKWCHSDILPWPRWPVATAFVKVISESCYRGNFRMGLAQIEENGVAAVAVSHIMAVTDLHAWVINWIKLPSETPVTRIMPGRSRYDQPGIMDRFRSDMVWFVDDHAHANGAFFRDALVICHRVSQLIILWYTTCIIGIPSHKWSSATHSTTQ